MALAVLQIRWAKCEIGGALRCFGETVFSNDYVLEGFTNLSTQLWC